MPELLELGVPPKPALCWRFDEPRRAISSASVGGGLGVRQWVLNAQVPKDYARTDLDVHLGALAAEARCEGEGIGLLTAASVARYSIGRDGDVVAFATVGLDVPTWAAAPIGAEAGLVVGTVNIVVFVSHPLRDAALVNAVATATEAKAQALGEQGVPGTGTASDAICVVTPMHGPEEEQFAGPRSRVGAPLARAVHIAVADGARHWLRARDPR